MKINKDGDDMPKLNVDLSQSEPIKCESCGSEVFMEGLMLRRISKLLIGAEQDAIIPIQIFGCAVCGNVNKGMRPKLD